MAKDIYKNTQERPINQKQGPRMGNGLDNGTKRSSFIKEKASGWRQDNANMIMRALEARDPKDFVDPKLEGLHSDTGPKRNPTAGGTKYNVASGQALRKITK